jgi:hypothetical protein
LKKGKNMRKRMAIALILGIVFLPWARSGNGIKADDKGNEEAPGNQASDLVFQSEEEKIEDILYAREEWATKRNRLILSVKKINFGIPGGDNWLVEWSNPVTDEYTLLILYLMKDGAILKDYDLGLNSNKDSESGQRIFDIMKDIPGTHIGSGTSSIGDFNGDGLDEIFTFGFGGNGKFILIKGYDAATDGIENYCRIPFDIIDSENGPAPAEFMIYKGMEGFKVYYVELSVAGGPSYVPDPKPDNDKWFFYTWDGTKKEYVRVEEVMDDPPAVTEPEEAVVFPPAAEPDVIEDEIPATEPEVVTPAKANIFAGIAAALLIAGALTVVLVLLKKKKKRA